MCKYKANKKEENQQHCKLPKNYRRSQKQEEQQLEQKTIEN